MEIINSCLLASAFKTNCLHLHKRKYALWQHEWWSNVSEQPSSNLATYEGEFTNTIRKRITQIKAKD